MLIVIFAMSYIFLSQQNGPLPRLWQVGVAWLLRELWTFPLFLCGVWSREIMWKGGRFKLKLGGKAVKLD